MGVEEKLSNAWKTFNVNYYATVIAGDFKCRIEANGTVTIEGVTTTGEKTVHRKHHTFQMTTRNLCPPGRFSVTFQLPGPVDPLQFLGFFGIEGIFEGLIKKKSD